MRKMIFIVLVVITGCQSTTISEQEVVQSLDVLFEIVDNEIDRLDEIVTNDFYIFENSRKYTKDEFVDYVKSFGDFTSERTMNNITVSTDVSSAHLTMTHHGEFLVNNGKQKLIYDWIESAFLKKEDNTLKFDFFFSEAVFDTIINID